MEQIETKKVGAVLKVTRLLWDARTPKIEALLEDDARWALAMLGTVVGGLEREVAHKNEYVELRFSAYAIPHEEN